MKKGLMIAIAGMIFMLSLYSPLIVQAQKKVSIVIPRNSVFVLSYFGARDAGVFKKHGIDLEIDARPFKGYAAALPSKQVFVTTYMGTAALAKITQGMDLVIIGGGLTVMQEVFVRKSSPYRSIKDLRGKKFGIWSTGAGAAKALRATLIDGYNIDYLNKKHMEKVQVSPPALMKLLSKGEVDSMFNISSLTIAAASQPDKYRSIFVPNNYWKKKVGQPIVWSAPMVAWRSWVEEDRDRAKRFVTANHEAFRWLRNPKNADTAIKKYAKLAGVKNDAQAETYKKWLKEKKIYLARWDKEVVDNQWKFVEMAKKVGVLKKLPSKDKHAIILE